MKTGRMFTGNGTAPVGFLGLVVSVVLMAYLAWPNDEERRNTFIATCLALFSAALAEEALPHSEELASFGGVAATAKPHSFRCWVKLRIWNVNGLRWRRYFN